MLLRLLRFLIFGAIVYFIFKSLQRFLRAFVNSSNQGTSQDAHSTTTPPPIDLGDVKDASFRDIHEEEKPS
ncbi:MAG: hypothetical protein A2059_01095 [Ignavibacteria bacterium GWA2_55_25]|nr:MAG: hypothetical protein A2059_01095 [Ignavibacteria bacterium GWA2_55_25]